MKDGNIQMEYTRWDLDRTAQILITFLPPTS